MVKWMLKQKNFILGIFLIMLGYYLPYIFEVFLVNMIVDIRKAIVLGDSGHLILTAALWSFFIMLQNTLIFNGIIIFSHKLITRLIPFKWVFVLFYMFVYSFVLIAVNQYSFLPVEFIPSLLAGFITLILISLFAGEGNHTERNIIISVQMFFAIQWINVMPVSSIIGFGTTDILASIKIASIYLGSIPIINFISLTFLATFFLSITMTLFLFATHDRNILIAKESYEKELALDFIHQKAVQNRVYEEVHSITHDLKTPLVTIRGLNSLISMTKDQKKLQEYTERIDNAVTKMTDMISGFLYESSKKIVTTEAVIDYVRAQLPTEDETLKMYFNLEKNLPELYINKIRVSRALINILENAMNVPTKYNLKKITVDVYKIDKELAIDIKDNGVGIPKEQMNKIWQIGYSTKKSTGIGLAFGKKVIEDNGGTIDIDSTVNIGTRVRITLPDEAYVDREEL